MRHTLIAFRESKFSDTARLFLRQKFAFQLLPFLFSFFASNPSPARKMKNKAAEVRLQRFSVVLSKVHLFSKTIGFLSKRKMTLFLCFSLGFGSNHRRKRPQTAARELPRFFFFDTSCVLSPFFRKRTCSQKF